jgi:hypothetical protein
MLHYFATHKGVTIGLIVADAVLAILMSILFETPKAAAAVVFCSAVGLGVAWLWQLEGE